MDAAMPTDMATLHSAWVEANPEKATRKATLLFEVITRFRGAVAAGGRYQLDGETDTVPTLGYADAVELILFKLGMGMGVNFSPEVSEVMTRADVWLRMVASGTTNPVPLGGGDASPSYKPPDERLRVLL